jgi:hypothetical protein
MPARSKLAASSKRRRLMVICHDYNGHKDVPVMMKSDDFRLTDPQFAGNYTIVGEGVYDHGTRALAVDGRAYHVFSDWSLGDPRSPSTNARQAA